MIRLIAVTALTTILFLTAGASAPHAASSRPPGYFYFAVRDSHVSSRYTGITPESLAGLLAQGVRPRDLLVPLSLYGSEAALEALLAEPLPKAETQQALIYAAASKKSLSMLQSLARLSPPGQYALDQALAGVCDAENQPAAAWLESLGANPRIAVLSMRSPRALAARLRALEEPPRQLGEKLSWGDPELVRVILGKKAYAPAHVYQALKQGKDAGDSEGMALLRAVPLKNRTYALMALGELPEGLTLAELRTRLPQPDPCLETFFSGADPKTTRVHLRDYENYNTLTGIWPDAARLSDLLECGANPSAGFVMVRGEEPRSHAEQRNLVRVLVEAGGDLRSYNMQHRMASWGMVDELKYLVAQGQSPSSLLFDLPVESLNLEAAQYLIDQGANPYAVLIEAVRGQHIAAREQALAWGADPTVGLTFSGQKYDLDAARRMLEVGAMAEAGLRFIEGAVFARGDAMDPKSVSFARLMVEHGAEPETAFGLPAVRNDLSAVRWLLEKGADPSGHLFSPWDRASIGLEGIAALTGEFAQSPRVSATALLDAAAKAREWDPPQPKVARIFEQAARTRTQNQ